MLTLFFLNKKNKLINESEQIKKNMELLVLEKEKYKNAFFNTIKGNGLFIMDSITLLDKNNNEKKFKTIISKKKKIIFRYNENACESCIESIFNKLKELNYLQRHQTIILCTYQNKKHFELFLLRNKIDINELEYYFVPDFISERLSIFDEKYLPYLFTSNSDSSISNLIVITPNNLNILDEYLNVFK